MTKEPARPAYREMLFAGVTNRSTNTASKTESRRVCNLESIGKHFLARTKVRDYYGAETID